MRRNQLYAISGIVALLGSAWIVLNYFQVSIPLSCPFKSVTSLPCPSCGTTTGIVELLKGNYAMAALGNPLSYLLLLMAVTVIPWILGDILFKTDTFYRFFLVAESKLRMPKFYMPLIIILLLVWANNLFGIFHHLFC